MRMHDENDFESLFDTSGSLSAEEVRQIAAEQTIRTLQALEQGTATVQRMVQVAREEMEKAHPGFFGRKLDKGRLCYLSCITLYAEKFRNGNGHGNYHGR